MNGDSKVPTTFVVPELEPWPMSCRGMPLGLPSPYCERVVRALDRILGNRTGMCMHQILTRGAYLNPRVIERQLMESVGGGKVLDTEGKKEVIEQVIG